MTPSPLILLAWSAFALAVAYAYGLRLLLAAGLAAAMGYGVAVTAQATGLDWGILLQRPEPLIPLGAAAFLLSFWRPLIRPEGFDRVWRLMGTAAVLLPLVFLATGTEAFSYRPLPIAVLQAVYDILGFGLPILAIGVRDSPPVARGGERGQRVPGAVRLREVLRLVVERAARLPVLPAPRGPRHGCDGPARETPAADEGRREMTRKGLWLAAAVVVVSNLWALGLAAVNRQGEPDAVLQLTEREVSLVPGGPENSAVSLRLAWSGPNITREAGVVRPGEARRARLRLPPSGDPGERETLLRRPGAARLRGPGVRGSGVAALRGRPGAERRYDVGRRRRHTSCSWTSIWTPPVFGRATPTARASPSRRRSWGPWSISEPGHAPRLRGRVFEVLGSDLNLPRNLRRGIEPLIPRAGRSRGAAASGAKTAPSGPRYAATIRWGGRLEPSVEAIRMTEERQ